MIAPIRGVLFDDAEVVEIARALDVLVALSRSSGARPTARLMALRDRLAAVAVGSENRTDGRNQGHEIGFDAFCGYVALTCDEAARRLGCTPGNVRDLARRGRIPAHRHGGTWLVSAKAVHDRARERGCSD